jgi:Domain of unknown function (DUF6966)
MPRMRHSGDMDPSESETAKNELLRVLDELAHLLREWNEDHWADWIERDRRLIADGHPDGLADLLGAFGGMGSLHDLVIDRANGHSIAQARVRPVNDRLRLLCSASVTKATELQAGLTSPS